MKNRKRKEGIALVIVLGFLALLVILAVSFVVSMRTERLAARSFMGVLRSRMIAEAALARVMDHIDSEMIRDDAMYPTWDVLSHQESDPTLMVTNLLAGEITNYIPGYALAEVRLQAADTGWSNIVDAVDKKLVGRFAYLIVDASGLVDPSVTGGSNRWLGVTPFEMSLGRLSEVNPGGVSSFLEQRSSEWKRFETLAELRVLGGSVGFFLPPDRRPVNFMPRTYFPVDKPFDGDFKDKVNIGTANLNTPTKKSAIVSALTSCNVPNPVQVFDNLLDYADADKTPRDLTSFCTEPVPMINEIICSNRMVVGFEVATGLHTYEQEVTLCVELWHPFRNNPGSFSMTPTPTVTFTHRYAPDSEGELEGLLPILSPGDCELDVNVGNDPAFRIAKYVYRGSGKATNQLVRYQLNIQIGELELRMGGTAVDRTSAIGQTIRMRFPQDDAIPHPGELVDVASYSCLDPRINYNVTDPYWKYLAGTSEVTPGTTNKNTQAYWDSGMGEPGAEMYVRNGIVSNAAELGFLSYGEPWKTIALYDGAHSEGTLHPVLDWFTASASTNPVKGKVNVNTPNEEVLAAVFREAPILPTPLDTPPLGGHDQLSIEDADELANAIAALNRDENKGVSVIGKAPFWANHPTMVNRTDAERESVIANTHRLLGYRQNLFTVILAAQSISDLNDDGVVDEGEVEGEQRLLAVVWRDPALVNGHHTSFIRFFRWMDD